MKIGVRLGGYEGVYEVSDTGQVRSLDRVILRGGAPSRIKGRVLKPSPCRGKYLLVTLQYEGKKRARSIHSLVAEAFIPNPDGYNMVRHKDNDRTNNAASNLAWGTHHDNVADRNGFTATRGRVGVCGRGHPLEGDNLRSVPKSRGCVSCLKACRARYRNKARGKRLAFPFAYLCDIYYMAVLAGHNFESSGYTLDDLEVKYGEEAKAWRASLQDQASAA